MRVLITGICGFVGSRIALGLLQRRAGLHVVGVDNLIRPGVAVNLEPLRQAGVEFHHGDVRLASDWETLPAVDWIIDAAANPSVRAGVDGKTSSRQLVEHNLLGTVNLLEYARRSKAGVALISTSRVYSIAALAALPLVVREGAFQLEAAGALPGGCTAAGINETLSTQAPVSLYGATKLASEALALEYGQAFSLPVIVDRCGVLAGAGQFGTAEQGIFSYWVRAYALRRPLRYLGFEGLGHQVRDALHPDDLTDLLDRQMQQVQAGPSSTRVWNVGGGAVNARSLRQLSDWCAGRFGKHEVTADPRSRPMDVPWVVMDAAAAQDTFDWRPSRTLPDILEEIARHHERHPGWLEQSTPPAPPGIPGTPGSP